MKEGDRVEALRVHGDHAGTWQPGKIDAVFSDHEPKPYLVTFDDEPSWADTSEFHGADTLRAKEETEG